MRNKLLFSAVIIVLSLLGTTNADAQWMSMTSRIVNPSFESESDEAAASFEDKERRTVTGWTLDYQNKEWTQYGTTSGSATSLGGVSTPPAAADGTKYLYLRTNWASGVTLSVSQTISGNWPAGYYRVSCKAYTFASKASAFGLSVQVGSDTPVTSYYNTANSSWQPWSVTIHKTDATTDLTITATMTPGGEFGGQNYGMLLDDFQLEYNPNEPTEGEVGGVYFLYSQYNDNGTGDQNRFLARGKNNGTRAVVDKYGIPLRLIYQDDGSVKMQFADGTNGYVTNTWFLNANGDANDANTFKMVASTVSGVEGYHFATQEVNPDLSARQYMYVWLINNTSGDYYAVAGNADNNVENDYTRTVWKLLTPAERNAIVAEYPGESLASVIDQARTGDLYPNLPPTETPASQYGYWIEAEYTAVDVTPGTWSYTAVRPGNKNAGTGDAAGTTELYQETGTFTQTLTGLQNGIYRIALQAFERHGSTDNAKRVGTDYGNVGAAYMTANDQQVHIAAWHEEYTGTNDPNTMAQAAARFNNGHYVNEVFAYVTDRTLTISVTEPGYLGANWFIMKDALTVTYFSPTKKTVATPEGEYYLYNVGTQKYMTFDGYWGTYYSMSDVGKRLTLETSTDGFTLMHTTYLSNTDDVESSHDTENYFYSHLGRKEHAFSNGNSHEGGEKWVFYQAGTLNDKPVYNIMNFMTDYYLSGDEGYDNNDSRGWGGKLKTTATTANEQWQLVTFSELKSALSASTASPQDASFLIDEPDFIVGYNNVYKEFYKWKVMGNDQFKYSDWGDDNIVSFHYDRNGGVSEGNAAYAYSLASDYPDILQTIEGIPNGLYVVECQAVFRDGESLTKVDQSTYQDNTKSSSRLNKDRLADGTYVNRAYLYANANMATPPDDARDLRDRYWIYENAQMVPVHAATADFDNLSETQILESFKNGEYTVQLPVYVDKGKLTIGLVQLIGINNNLLAFDRFRLKYYGTNNFSDAQAIAKANLVRLQRYYKTTTDGGLGYQSNTITTPEVTDLTTAISNIDTDYSTAADVAQYNQAARDYGETSINWYIYNVLQTDYDRGDYKTVAYGSDRVINRTPGGALYPFVDDESKKAVVKYFGAGTNTNNDKSWSATPETYLTDSRFGSASNMRDNGGLDDLKAAISALRTYVVANSEVRYLENGLGEDEAEAARNVRLALRPGTKEAVDMITPEGVRRFYEINPVMFANTGAKVMAPPVNKIMTNARCWAPRGAHGHRYYDYTNYWWDSQSGQKINHVEIEGLMTGEYLVTISESHNHELGSLKFNYEVGGVQQYTEDVELFRGDESVWQIYTHSWQDISCRVNITQPFQKVDIYFKGGANAPRGATMNICNLRIYRMSAVQTLLLDENEPVLAKNGMTPEQNGAGYKGYHGVKTYFKRTMAKNQWNTLVLPVNLTKQQVVAAFGKGTILATMDGFATDYPTETQNPDNCIHFTTDDMSDLNDNQTAITEGKVYLIRPTADPAVPAGEKVHFKNDYENRPNYVEIEGPIYFISYVDYHVSAEERNPDVGQGDKEPHDPPPTADDGLNTKYLAKGVQEDKLTLQMQGSYGKTLVRVNQPDENGGTNYIYAFQQQSDGAVRLVELEGENTYNETDHGIAGTGRLFKGYRGWAVANYKTGADVRQTYTVLLDEGDNELTIIRGIDSADNYSETKVSRQGIYDLQGRPVDAALYNSPTCPKGVYIVDGQKVVKQ
jgi:hypothetical protein